MFTKKPELNWLHFYPICFLFICVSALKSNAQVKQQESDLPDSPRGFIRNEGQIVDQDYQRNPEVLFLLPGEGVNVQLRKTGFSYDTWKEQSGSDSVDLNLESSSLKFPATKSYTRNYHRVDVELLDCNADAEVIGIQPSEYFNNYYTVGTDENGVTNVRQYRQVMYRNIYNNIDLQFICSEQKSDNAGVKYNFIIHPGGNIEDIQLRYAGAKDIYLLDGNITISVESGLISENIPRSYLENNNKDVKVEYVAQGQNIFSFQTAEIIPSDGDFIIDPGPCLGWGTYFGGSGHDRGYGISLDDSSNVYLTGETFSANNIATAGAHQVVSGGSYDVFIAKFDSTGSIRRWATYYGGAGVDVGYGITVSSTNHVFVTGATQSTSNIASVGTYQTSFGSGTRVTFVAEFGALGNRVWGTYYGSAGWGSGTSIQLDGSGNVCVGGYSNGDVNIATPGAFQVARSGDLDAIIGKFNSTGTALIWGSYFGGIDAEYCYGIVLDSADNIYFTGLTRSLTNIATAGAFQTIFGGPLEDGFLAKVNSSGTARVWSTYYGGNDWDESYCIAIDDSANIYIAGRTYSTNNISTPGAYDLTWTGGYDAFVAKFRANGTRMWGTYYGGAYLEYAYSIYVDDDHDVYLTGYTGSPSGIATVGAYRTTLAGSLDVFVAKLNNLGSQLVWGTYYGGAYLNYGYSIVLGNNNKVFIAGYTNSLNLIATVGAFQTIQGGGNNDDAFVASLGCTCTIPPQPSVMAGPAMVCSGSVNTYSVPSNPAVSYYLWSLPGGWTGSSITNSISVTVGSIGDTVFVYATNSCGSSLPSYITVTVNPTPNVFSNAGNDTICAGQFVTLNGTGNAVNYTWNPGNLNGATVNTAPLSTTTYTVVGTSAQGCVDSSTVTVNVIFNPALVVVGDSSLCTGDSTSLTASGAVIYSWNPGNFSGSILTDSPSATTTYTVIGTGANGCSDTTNIVVTVNSLPLVNLNLSPIDTQCVSSGPITLIGGSPSGGAYTGNFVSAGSFDPSSAGAGIHDITYSYSDNNGCMDTAIAGIYVDLCLGMGLIGPDDMFELYPNPVIDILHVETKEVSNISIYNSLGILVLDVSSVNGVIEIDVSDYAVGAYFLIIKSANKMQAIKIIKT